MYNSLKIWLFLALLLIENAQRHSTVDAKTIQKGGTLKSAVFKSPAFTLGPGDVQNKFYYGIDFPKGHIALKGFDAEVVDDKGNSVPLNEVYLHHWIVERFYHKKPLTGEQKKAQNNRLSSSLGIISGRNDGLCPNVLGQYFGLGSETRHTRTFIPDPYGIVVGDPKKVPPGYEESWFFNIHAIDTRGAANLLGCTECRCDLYNVTKDEYGRPLRPDYIGGLYCCYDGTHCQLKARFQAERRTYYLKYRVTWMDWSEAIVPARVYILDVTDTGDRSPAKDNHTFVGCKVEYDVPSCTGESVSDDCIHTSEANLVMPEGGDVVYAVSHQHAGGIGSVLYGEDGREICSSLPKYGKGSKAGNELGYIVGMSTCYPEPGSMKVYDGEKLQYVSRYTKDNGHTGVMGLFYLLLADRISDSTTYGSISTM
eukprot:TRINITY_DN484_c0_g1_i1.p1 TRINITY_DN484_c0_g1~~TRINITY_DN484_c0_g1_i1.p1  ORF type:complete len:425 (+),score=57.60 TRINITY_DN484_c0_g1_i1:625-1899(+)